MRFERLEPAPREDELPEALPSPFDEGPPHPLAARAAALLVRALTESEPNPREGKMWGVLVARAPDGVVGWLRAFSGQLDGRWQAFGAAPPIFDVVAREGIEGPGAARVAAMVALREAVATEPDAVAARARSSALEVVHAEARAQLAARHAQARAARQAARVSATAAEADALDAESRAQKAERRRVLQEQAEARAEALVPVEAHEARLRGLDAERQAECAALMRALLDTYVLHNVLGETSTLRALFAPLEPPSGAGDCAAPKLLNAARAQGLRPLALTELWWGPPPPGGGRVHGRFYPACRSKCGPLLPFLLRGQAVADPRPVVRSAPDGLQLAYADPWIWVVDKPAGLLSVPGRGPARADCVEARVRAAVPEATGPLLVHRLDEDTSGLLLVALDAATHRALQRQFLDRSVQKTYVAWVHGRVQGGAGTIDLALRPDYDDRPRQVHDPHGGRPATTHWRVLAQDTDRTLVELRPVTGRTHQLRVHAAHPLGLNAPIVGDRLYGDAGPRLLLHAAVVEFTHPVSGARVRLESPAPFAAGHRNFG